MYIKPFSQCMCLMCEPSWADRRIIFSLRTLNLTSICVRECLGIVLWPKMAVNGSGPQVLWVLVPCQVARRQNWGISVESDAWRLMKRAQKLRRKALKLQQAFLLIALNWITFFLSTRLKRNMKITILSDFFLHSFQFFCTFIYLDYFAFFLPFHHFN